MILTKLWVQDSFNYIILVTNVHPYHIRYRSRMQLVGEKQRPPPPPLLPFDNFPETAAGYLTWNCFPRKCSGNTIVAIWFFSRCSLRVSYSHSPRIPLPRTILFRYSATILHRCPLVALALLCVRFCSAREVIILNSHPLLMVWVCF